MKKEVLLIYIYRITANTMRYSLGDNIATNPTRMGGLIKL